MLLICEDKLTCNRNWVIARVETMLEGIVDGLLADEDELSITLTSRAGVTRRGKGTSRPQGSIPPAKTRKINFPGSNAQEAWRFSLAAASIVLADANTMQLFCCVSWKLFMSVLSMMWS